MPTIEGVPNIIDPFVSISQYCVYMISRIAIEVLFYLCPFHCCFVKRWNDSREVCQDDNAVLGDFENH
jgi:hypothetical protein